MSNLRERPKALKVDFTTLSQGESQVGLLRRNAQFFLEIRSRLSLL